MCEDNQDPLINGLSDDNIFFFSKNNHSCHDLEPSNLNVEFAREFNNCMKIYQNPWIYQGLNR